MLTYAAHYSFPRKCFSRTAWVYFTFKAQRIPEDYAMTVKETHEKGGYGSIGYRYSWQKTEAMKNLLRTHTTAISRYVDL